MDLQRASAGSGKTFQLAKTYIRDFITEARDVPSSHARKGETVVDGNVRHYFLRTEAGLAGSHSHILAITFTNKATNEMKERIVEKLADLARGHRLKKGSDGRYLPPEYLRDFLNEFYGPDGAPATEQQIRATCNAALRELLNNYSDFNISTIDSFFQLVLRTFTYELGLSDTFRLELDDDYLASSGIDETFSSLNRTPDPHKNLDVRWVKSLISSRMQSEQSWDFFRRSDTRGKNPYSELFNLVRSTYSEHLKEKVQKMVEFFQKPEIADTGMSGMQCFQEYSRATARYYTDAVRCEATRCKETVKKIREGIEKVCGKDADPDKVLVKGLWTVLRYYLEVEVFSGPKITGKKKTKIAKELLSGQVRYSDRKITAKAGGNLEKSYPELRSDIADAGDAAASWLKAAELRISFVSRLYSAGILAQVMGHITDFRNENNLLPLSETNTILRRIIRDDDVPFIFERLGPLLRHFLIDEFQDTSRLQWMNLLPLLRNSESYGSDNLIIGDAKQSIYRFRNAEPDLISMQVEKDIPTTNLWQRVTPNRNWRSARQIVDFNNRLFEYLATTLDSRLASLPALKDYRKPMKPVYFDVKQQIQKEDVEGYVEITFQKKSDFISLLGEKISGLLAEGWRQSDIAVLCDTNSECDSVIESLLSYNASHRDEPDFVPIEIVSDEALHVRDSQAVKVILAVLTIVAENLNLKPSQGEESGRPAATDSDRALTKRLSAEKLDFLYQTVCSNNPGLDVTQINREQLEEAVDPHLLHKMLDEMTIVTLPSLVDAITATFVSESLRKSDAAYISAFMDTVLDYCASYTADPASFMSWWNLNKNKINVSSPKGANAVNVMTIHKSKGLEFQIVIIPDTWAIDISHREKTIMWVEPCGDGIEDKRILPPYIPIVLNSHEALCDSPYAKEYIEEYDRSRTDKLNEAYVAFTRAVRMLFINTYLSKTSKDDSGESEQNSLTLLMLPFLTQLSKEQPEQFTFTDELFTYGKPLHPEPQEEEEPKEEEPEEEAKIISDYYVNPPLHNLKIRSASGDESGTPNDEESDDEESRPIFCFGTNDPRTCGILLHEILSNINRAEDTDRVLRRYLVQGRITSAERSFMKKRIEEALSLPEAKEWFAGHGRIITERSLICSDGSSYRPDRIIDNGEVCTIVDYKTGEQIVKQKYREQLRKYMSLMSRRYAAEGEQRRMEGRILFIPAEAGRKPCAVKID